MGETAITRPSLLARVRDPRDQEAWQQFAELYAPLVYQFARKRGLQDADAADLTQIVLQEVSQAIKHLRYDPQRGSFRGWLFGVVRHQLHKLLERQKRAVRGSGDTAAHDLLEEQPDREHEEAGVWNAEYERQLFLWAAQRVRDSFEDSSWQAFWQTAVEGKSAKEAGELLGMTVGAIYTAKSRVLDRIKKEIQQIQEGE